MESATCKRGFSIRTLTKTAQRYSLGDSLLAAVMMIDMNGPDFEAVNEVKELILEFLKVWKNYKKWNARGSTAGVTRGSRSAQGTSNVYSQLSGLENVVFNDFIKDDFIPEADAQVVSGSVSLPDPVVVETEEQMKESKMRVMCLMHWVSLSLTPECLWRTCLRLLT